MVKRIAPCAFDALLLALPGTSFCEESGSFFSWPWSSQNPSPPPEYSPYSLPTFEHHGFDYNDSIPALEQAPYIDGNAVFAATIACYPAKDKWRIDVDLEARIRDSGVSSFDPADGTALGSSYIGLVARMPIYSATEMDRQRTHDYQRRTATAGFVADFVAGIAERNHALRELGLYSSLEARARIRVQQGVAGAEEQVLYLEKVASAQAALVKSETKIMNARLSLVAACSLDKANSLNAWLSRQAQVPVVSRLDETRVGAGGRHAGMDAPDTRQAAPVEPAPRDPGNGGLGSLVLHREIGQR
uniref:Outer membrane efflux protein n=1 Tax=Candidatus Kentrum sp. LFY TaxID=2126342 RepID=A0A450UBE9_9GAMM|nr:MAG: hypothetical protein BECKLFY1418B_GA0070995_101613 [Candidatus Kentron sp. LFY]